MAVLWQRMADKFPNRWLPQLGEYDPHSIAVDSWRETLRGIRMPMLLAGLRALDRSGAGWPPSAPEFRQLCLDVSIPGVDVGLTEACGCTRNWHGHTWSHPVIYHAAKEVGHWRLMTEPRSVLTRPWAAAYQKYLQRYLDGEEMPTPAALLIEHQKPQRSTAAAAAPHIAEIQRKLGITPTGEPEQ